jgi:glycine cleavage system protein P-like pyridoxal-binding family
VTFYKFERKAKRKAEYNVSAKDVPKALLDIGIHPPTMYYHQIVLEALMIWLYETGSKQTLYFAIQTFWDIYHNALTNGHALRYAHCPLRYNKWIMYLWSKFYVHLRKAITPKVDNVTLNNQILRTTCN